MTLFAFTYANACTAMKGFDTNKNKKLEDEERSKLVYYIQVNINRFKLFNREFWRHHLRGDNCFRVIRDLSD